MCEPPILVLDIGDATPHDVTTGMHVGLADLAVYSLASQHGYFVSRRPTIAAMIAIPMRKSCSSIAGAIDRVPHARGITALV